MAKATPPAEPMPAEDTTNLDPFADSVLYGADAWVPDFNPTITKHMDKLLELGRHSVTIANWDPSTVSKYIYQMRDAGKYLAPGRRMKFTHGTIKGTDIPALQVVLYAASETADTPEA